MNSSAKNSVQEDVIRVVNFISQQAEFTIPERDPQPYNHMGATLTDAALQAGINYDHVVAPRVQKVKNDYPEVRTTTAFQFLLQTEGAEKVLNWDGEKKIATLTGLIELFQREAVETEADLAKWLEQPDSENKLRVIRGIGNKTCDYFWLLCGLDGVAVDVHLSRFAQTAGVSSLEYHHVREVITETAHKLSVSPARLDNAIWQYQRRRKR